MESARRRILKNRVLSRIILEISLIFLMFTKTNDICHLRIFMVFLHIGLSWCSQIKCSFVFSSFSQLNVKKHLVVAVVVVHQDLHCSNKFIKSEVHFPVKSHANAL